MGTARRLTTLAVGLAALAGTVAGCGTRDGTPPAASRPPTVPSSPSAQVPAAATLAPDGTVPWVNEPAGDNDFATPTTPPPVPTGPTCKASQLNGTLTHWTHKSTGGEVNDPTMDGSLYGYAVLTNTSHAACHLHGIPTLRLAADGTAVPLGHSGSRDTDSAVGLPPGGKANFRMDWDAPYCPASQGHYTLNADLPGAGDVPVVLADQTVPGCTHDDLHPDLASFLTPGPVSSGDAQPAKPVTSTLSSLTARAEVARKDISPGQTLDFTVTLSNPTGKEVSLAGRPGFTLDVLCTGTQGREGISNGTKAYLLNNRPVHGVPAHGSVRFAVRAAVPKAPSFPGPKLYITWRMITQGLPSGLPFVVLTVPTGA
jgi:hypothetical protein